MSMLTSVIDDKRAIARAVITELEAEVATLTRLALDAADAATHEENKPENEKDMRSTEASYLAAGQAERVRELERAIGVLSTMSMRAFDDTGEIALSAIVDVSIAGKTQTLFLVGDGGGRRARAKVGTRSIDVQLVTPGSPLGRALVGAVVGDELEIDTPQGKRTVEIVSVA
ncbi:MAG: GreA/GreB family elongation factor [Polyangiales bacterium]